MKAKKEMEMEKVKEQTMEMEMEMDTKTKPNRHLQQVSQERIANAHGGPLKLLLIGGLLYLFYRLFAISTPPSIGNLALVEPAQIVLDALELNYARNWSQKYTAEAHLAGTNYPLVEWTEQKFLEYGFDTTIDSYEILASYPKDHSLSLLDKHEQIVYTAPLKEDSIDEDPTTHNNTVPTFLGYAANGNVTAQYVYANYGTKSDFEALKEHNVDVTGKIVVVRYGKIFRGLKVKFAQDRGAVGVLIYSDPGDDFGITPKNGYKQYPHGPARQESSVQRGSVQFLGGEGSAPGDPTTPGYASKPGVERKDPHTSIGKIPVLPISYREVKPILQKLNGKGAKVKGFEGELDGFEYTTGPSEYSLNLYSDQDFKYATMWNVYGEIKGEKADEVIILGNHRDAWIKGGAGDPNSGSATLLEVARALGTLKAKGHKFKRTIVLHSYDGEEYGLLGSTEQGEYFAKKYQREVVAYLNLDVSVSGKNLGLGSSPVLNNLLLDVAKELEYPEGGSLYDHYVKVHGSDAIKSLGSGSDYTVYLEHLGIPSVDLGFGGGKKDPIYHYHSNYDSFHWMEKFGDKNFVYHNLAAKYLALLALRLSEKEVIQFRLESYASNLIDYFEKTSQRVPAEWLNKTTAFSDYRGSHLLDEDTFIRDVTQSQYTCPMRKNQQMRLTHGLNCFEAKKTATLGQRLDQTLHLLHGFQKSAQAFDEKSLHLQDQADNYLNLSLPGKIWLHLKIRKHNRSLKYFERNFLHHEGLDTRPWFKHILFASGRFTGYAGQDLPGLNEAIEDGDLGRLSKWIGILDRTVHRVSHHLHQRVI